MGKTLRVLKLAVIRYPNALGGLAFIGVRSFKHTIYFATKLVFPYVFSTWKIFVIFQVVVVGRFHSITLSLPVRHLEIRGGELPYEKQGILVGKFEFNSYGRLMQVLASSCLPEQILNFPSNLFTHFDEKAQEFT